MPADGSTKGLAWAMFDEVVARATQGSPWLQGDEGIRYQPDYDVLGLLLAVPLHLGATIQSGVPALALDVWVAHEFRRAGFSSQAVWPRSAPPRVLPTEVASLIENLPSGLRSEVGGRIREGKGLKGVGSSAANILGKNYVKQVDVGLATWQTGPQLLVSTKRMDSSLGKNAANRVEESYGDAKNLRSRYPLAALGFVYALRGGAKDHEPVKAEWLIDLLGKLGKEEDAYDEVVLLVPEFEAASPDEPEPDDALDATSLGETDPDPGTPSTDPAVAEQVANLTPVRLRHKAVPPDLRPEKFFAALIEKMLSITPIDFHAEARALRGKPTLPT